MPASPWQIDVDGVLPPLIGPANGPNTFPILNPGAPGGGSGGVGLPQSTVEGISLLEKVLSEIQLDGVEYAECVEQNSLDWGAMTAFSIGNPIANLLAGDTGRMGFGGLGPHATSWQHKVGAALTRATRNPVFSRAGKLLGRASLVPTVLEGSYDIGTMARCATM